MTADGTPVSWSWVNWGGARGVGVGKDGLRIDYQLSGTPQVALADYASAARRVLSVAVDPSTAKAATDGILRMSIDGGAVISVRIAAVLPRLPTVTGPFVLADLAALTTQLDLYHPGQSAQEFWLDVPPRSQAALAARALKRDPLTQLSIAQRAEIEQRLASDPVAQGSRTLLAIVAFLALAVAALALLLLVIGERRDGAGELYAWEADGLTPGLLRRTLALRAIAVATLAVPIGFIGGVLLTRAGVTLVAVDASGTAPVPPLHAVFGWARVLVELAVGVGLALALTVLVVGGLLRERAPVPAEADLR